MGEGRKIVLACSFGRAGGIGHAGRCASLAQCAKALGWRAVLWSESDPDILPLEMRQSFDDVVVGSWLSESELPAVVAEADYLVIDDLYSTDDDYARLRVRLDARQDAPLVLVIDDLKTRRLDSADFVLNQELALGEADYAPRKASFLGERYALLRAGLGEPEDLAMEIPNGSLPVLIMIGGTDPFGLTTKTLDGLLQGEGRLFCPLVVLGENHPDFEKVAGQLRRFESGRLFTGVSSRELAGICSACRFAIIGCGTTVYEMAALRLPFVGLQLVDNQRAMSKVVREKWTLPIIPCEKGLWDEAVFDIAVRSIAANDRPFETNVDLQGARRVLEALEVARKG